MTNFDKIKNMNIDELAKFFIDRTEFPDSPCYLCQYDEGLNCNSPVICTKEYGERLYKEWLEKEVIK